jgi:hypothetical protein
MKSICEFFDTITEQSDVANLIGRTKQQHLDDKHRRVALAMKSNYRDRSNIEGMRKQHVDDARRRTMDRPKIQPLPRSMKSRFVGSVKKSFGKLPKLQKQSY